MEGCADGIVKSWVQEIERLADFSRCHPQAALWLSDHAWSDWSLDVCYTNNPSLGVRHRPSGPDHLIDFGSSNTGSSCLQWLAVGFADAAYSTRRTWFTKRAAIGSTGVRNIGFGHSLVGCSHPGANSFPESVSQKQQQLKTPAVRLKTASLQALAQSVVDQLPPQEKEAVGLAKEKGLPRG